jgi:polysaccharide export outer membrane protein
MKRVLLYLSVALALAGCSTKSDLVLFHDTNVSSEEAGKSVTVIGSDTMYEYRIRPHDRISITMYNHPELGTTSITSQRQDTTGVLVDSKGYVRLPLVKSIHIGGLTQPAAQAKIEKAYKAYLEDAELNLQVLNKRAYVLGEVKKPGEINLYNEKATLLQVLAAAGDLTDYANRHAIVIMKQRKNTVETETVDLTGANSIKMANLMIYPGDTIYVAPNGVRAFNIGVSEASPVFRLIGDITQPIVNVKYLENN